MLKKIFSFFLFFVITYKYSQNVQLSEFSEVSIVTSGAGEALYEKFGHTAIRIKDPVLNLDLIYNYGFFNFNQPNFYLNFVKGFMKYQLVKYPFDYSFQDAKRDERWMKQQVLNLTQKERNAFFNFLEENSLPQNADYLYDPFFNNCATKPRDIIKKIVGGKLIFSDDFTSNKSLRQLMNIEINPNTWGSLGINIALGSILDKKATPEEYLYLPDYVFKALQSSKISGNGVEEKFVKKTEILLDFDEKAPKSDAFSPFLCFLVISLIIIFITYKDVKRSKRTKFLDFLVFLFTGLVGSLIIFLWFFTNHSTAPNNFNFLWGFAPNLIVSFFVFRKKMPKWFLQYNKVLLILLGIIPVIWLSKIQLFNWTLLPFFISLTIRYWFLQKTLNS